MPLIPSLTKSELEALRRGDIDLDGQIVRVMRQLSEVRGSAPAFGAPKSDAGRRAVVIPAVITPDLTWHLARFTAPGDDALVFTSRNGAPLRHTNFRRRHWLPALCQTGLTNVHFHDLRHAGNHLAAVGGATLRELMDRMGHSTSRAALIYLHGSMERQQMIADAISEQVRQQMTSRHNTASGKPGTEQSGTYGHDRE